MNLIASRLEPHEIAPQHQVTTPRTAALDGNQNIQWSVLQETFRQTEGMRHSCAGGSYTCHSVSITLKMDIRSTTYIIIFGDCLYWRHGDTRHTFAYYEFGNVETSSKLEHLFMQCHCCTSMFILQCFNIHYG